MELAIGPPPVCGSISAEAESPSPFVHLMVMLMTDRAEIGQVRTASVMPLDSVMDLASIEVHVTVGDGARCVHRPQCPPLPPGGQTRRAADIECLTLAVEHDWDQVRFARQPAGRRDRDR